MKCLEFRKWLKTTRVGFVEDTHLYAGEPPVPWNLKPDPGLNHVASKYMTSKNMDPKTLDISYNPLNSQVGKHLADVYEKLEHKPDSLAVTYLLS